MLYFPELTRPDVWTEYPVDLVDWLLQVQHVEAPDKMACPLFGAYRLVPGGQRRNLDVEAITHLALDFDEGPGTPPAQLADALGALQQFSGVVYSTFSHGGKGTRFRAVLRLTREVLPGEWPAFWARAVALFPGADPQCKDVSRAMFVPSCPPGAERFTFGLTGAPLDPDRLPTVAPSVEALEHTAPIDRTLLQRVIVKLWRENDAHKADLASRLKLASEGVAFAAEGERDSATFAIVCALVREIRNVTPQAILATLKQSLDVMREPSGALAVPYAKVLDMADRAVAKNKEIAAEEVKPDVAQPSFHGKTLERLAALNTLDPIKSLVLQDDSDYWVLSLTSAGYQYTPCKREALVKQAEDKLSTLGVSIILNGSRPRKMRAEEILDAFGMPIESVVKSFEVEEPEIRRHGPQRDLILPAKVKRDLEPTYSPDVAGWLETLGGAHREKLLDWLVLACDTSYPLCALVLIGADSTGKSLLAKEISKIWTRVDPVPLSRVLGDSGFNDLLEECPIVFADEDLPRDKSGRVRSAEIREFIQRGRHAVNAKYRKPTFLEGFPRLVCAANNDRVLDFGTDELTPADLAAIQKRLLVLRVPNDAAGYLDGQDVGAWLESDTIARHVLWLLETRQVERNGRFGVDTAESYASALTHSTGLRSQVVEWIVKHVLNPTRCVARSERRGDYVAVRLADVEAHWSVHLSTRVPRTDKLSAASRVFEYSAGGWIVVPIADLTAWATGHNFCAKGEIFAALDGFSARKGLAVVR